MKKKNSKIIKYLFVGGVGQLTDYSATLLLISISKNIFYSNLLGYIIGSILTYIGHTKYTFKKNSRKLSSKLQILLFSASCINGIIVGYFILKILIQTGTSLSHSKIIQLIFIAITQYLFNSKLTFNLK